RNALERRSPLATADDHLNRRESSRRRLGAIRLLPRDPAFFEKLKRDIHVRSWPGELFHEILHHPFPHFIILILYPLHPPLPEKNRIRSNAQIMLNLAQNNLLARPAMLQNPLKPGMLPHRDFTSIAPELFDKCIGVHELPSNSRRTKCLWPTREVSPSNAGVS